MNGFGIVAALAARHAALMSLAAESRVSIAGAARSVLRVEKKTPQAQGVVSLSLVDPDGARLPDWTPGSHIDLLLPGDRVRQYSLCGDRWDPFRYEIAILREPAGRGGSAYVHDHLAEGDLVGFGGPRNNFHLVPAARYLFIAGGIGITPLLPMVEQAKLLGIPWILLYGGRSRSSMAYLPRLARWGSHVKAWPEDELGLPPLREELAELAEGSKIYVCGPGALIAVVEAACADLPAGRLRTERFVPREVRAPVRSAPFEVELARSGTTVTVTPETSVLDAVARAGANILSSCRQGTCGTCETTVIDGVPDHRDSLTTDRDREMNDHMYVCVSRSCSDRLVLDV